MIWDKKPKLLYPFIKPILAPLKAKSLYRYGQSRKTIKKQGGAETRFRLRQHGFLWFFLLYTKINAAVWSSFWPSGSNSWYRTHLLLLYPQLPLDNQRACSRERNMVVDNGGSKVVSPVEVFRYPLKCF